MTSQKTLYILRHAKAEAGASYRDDHERPLMERGIEAADTIGKYMVRRGIVPDRALCSTAERASETWLKVQSAYKQAPPTEYNEKLYLAAASETMQLIARTPETVGSLLIVGHNPGLHQLCLKLAKTGEEEMLNTLTLKFPTCAFAAIGLGKIAWNDIAQARGELKLFITPKMLASMIS